MVRPTFYCFQKNISGSCRLTYGCESVPTNPATGPIVLARRDSSAQPKSPLLQKQLTSKELLLALNQAALNSAASLIGPFSDGTGAFAWAGSPLPAHPSALAGDAEPPFLQRSTSRN
jgi:hypothetical protein